MTSEPTTAQGPDRGDTYRSIWRDLMDVGFQQGYVRAAGLRTRYVTAGSPDRPPLLLLHAAAGSWETYSANLGPLAQHFHCFAPDMLGCGFTDKPDRPYEIQDYVEHILDFMDAMDIPSTSLIGTSLGSWVGARLAHDYPHRVTRMILNAPAGLLDMSSTQRASSGSSVLDPTWENIRTGLLESGLFFRPETLIDDIIAIRLEAYRRHPNVRRLLTLFDPEVRRRNLLSEAAWQEITTPTLLVEHVDCDDYWLATARGVAKLLPNVATVEMREVSHWPPYEKPAEFNDLALRFLAAGSPT